MGNSNSTNGENDEENRDGEDSSNENVLPNPPPAPAKPLSAFERFEFEDLSEAAKSMFVDRKDSHSFQVRGANYLTDKKKVHPGPALCKLMLLELYEVESKDGDRHDHISARGLAKKRREVIASLPGNPYQLIVNFQIPGDPPVSIVTYFAVPPHLQDAFKEDGDFSAINSLFEQFTSVPATEEARVAAWETGDNAPPLQHTASLDSMDEVEQPYVPDEGELPGIPEEPVHKEHHHTHHHHNPKDHQHDENHKDTHKEQKEHKDIHKVNTNGHSNSWMKMPSDISWPEAHEPGALPPTDFRNLRFKLIPSVTEGPWVVKAAVRSQPALLGRKVVQRYFRGEGYMEIDVHVGSSVIASQIVGVCRGYGKHFAADVGIVIQGEDPSELPEKMLACCSFHKIDMEVRQFLD